MSDQRLRLATLAVHAPDLSRPVGAAGERSHVPPLYQTASWEVEDAAGNDAVAEGRGYFYARYGSPNSDGVAQTVARMEGAEAGVCFASGMAALSAIFEGMVGPGGTLVTVRGIYGGTLGLVEDLARRQGILVRYADAPRVDAIAPLLDGASLVHLETISNPLLRVADLDGIGALCSARKVPISVDGTFASPVLSRPISRGASLVMHSATKYLCGHGDVCAGVVVGARALIDKLSSVLRLQGAVLDPFAAWLLQRGLRTLHLRVSRQVENARTVAAGLEALVEKGTLLRVHYPGLRSHPDHALAESQLDGPGAMVSFEVAGDTGSDGASDGSAPSGAHGAALRTFDRVRLIRRMASLGDVQSMMLHPASTSHRSIPAAERARAGITDALLRLSVGIEDPRDLLDDLVQALGAS